jgi:riboflavin kinase/FMN adenylyltransferase
VLNDESRPFYLTLPEKRAELLGELGVDHILTYPFTKQTVQKSAEAFILELRNQLNFSDLWIGYDFALGKNREGNADRLSKLGQLHDFRVWEIPAFHFREKLVSSSQIRKLLREGEVKDAADLLGRPFEISGEVIKGDNRGKSLGFATSNLNVASEKVNIKPGVYACLAEVDDQVWKAVTNVGYRPTFGPDIDSPRIETHLLDFSRDLYSKIIEVRFIKRLRDEKKFDQVGDLIDQVQKDISRTREILSI